MHAMLHNQAHLPPAYFTNLLPDNVKHGEVIKAFSFLLWIFNLWIISRSLCKWRRLSSQNYKIINQHTLLQVTLCDSFCQLKCFMVPFCPRQKSDLCHWLTSGFTRSPFSTPIRSHISIPVTTSWILHVHSEMLHTYLLSMIEVQWKITQLQNTIHFSRDNGVGLLHSF